MTRSANPARTGNSASASSHRLWRQLPPLAFVLAGAFPAWAELVEYTPSADPTGNVIGVIVITNNEGSSTQDHTVETEHGPVRLSYTTSVNYPYYNDDMTLTGCCPDTARIVDIPEGVLPSEWEIEVNENGTAEIVLYHYVGG